MALREGPQVGRVLGRGRRADGGDAADERCEERRVAARRVGRPRVGRTRRRPHQADSRARALIPNSILKTKVNSQKDKETIFIIKL